MGLELHPLTINQNTNSEEDFLKIFQEHEQRIKQQYDEYNGLYNKYLVEFCPTESPKYNDYILPDIKIVNIVVSTKLKNIDIDRIKRDMNTEYYPEEFPGFVYRLHDPKSAMLLFKTGKVICTGVKNIDDAVRALHNFCGKFDLEEDDNKTTNIDNINIQNLVVSVNFRYYIELEDAANSIPRAIYEPDQFPGIIYRHSDPQCVFLIFSSGKCICVGSKKVDDAFKSIFAVRKMLIDNELFISPSKK